MPTKTTRGLTTSLVGRKIKCKIRHIWFDKDRIDMSERFSLSLPTDEGTIVAAFTSKEDGSTVVKLLAESEKGEIMETYAEHIDLVPLETK